MKTVGSISEERLGVILKKLTSDAQLALVHDVGYPRHRGGAPVVLDEMKSYSRSQ